MHAHTARVELQTDGRLVLQGLPFQRGDVVEVSLLKEGAPASLTPEQVEQSRLLRASRRGSVTFAENFDPAASACPVEGWEAFRGDSDSKASSR